MRRPLKQAIDDDLYTTNSTQPSHTMAPVQFWSTPGLYVKWAARNKPAIFWSIVVGSVGPVMALVVPPIRARFGDGPRPQIPLTYPSESLSAVSLRSIRLSTRSQLLDQSRIGHHS